jgi:hypothetical protein
VVPELLLPDRVAQALRGRGRVDDVGHEQGGQDPLGRGRQGEVLDVAEEVEEHRGLVADDPGVVPRRHLEHIARLELDLLAVVHADAQPPRQEQLEVVDLA